MIAAIGFEVFKLVASIYLKAVLRSPAGATFGPVLGLMVFAYITARLLLLATAWAATSTGYAVTAPAGPPEPAVITTRVQLNEGLTARQAMAAVVVGRWSTWSFPTAQRPQGLVAWKSDSIFRETIWPRQSVSVLSGVILRGNG